MDVSELLAQFKKTVCDQVRIEPEGLDRYRVFTPFRFSDGDMFVILFKRREAEWVLSDEGHTFMHLSYTFEDRELRTGTRSTLIERALSAFGITEDNGELYVLVEEGRYGDALFSFVQAISKIADLTYLTRERVRSTFRQDFSTFFEQFGSRFSLQFDWYDSVRDPEKKYPVDCVLTSEDRRIFVFALSSDRAVDAATIALLTFEKWGIRARSIGIFEDQQEISRISLARFSDVGDKQFSSLRGNEERISNYLRDEITAPVCAAPG